MSVEATAPTEEVIDTQEPVVEQTTEQPVEETPAVEQVETAPAPAYDKALQKMQMEMANVRKTIEAIQAKPQLSDADVAKVAAGKKSLENIAAMLREDYQFDPDTDLKRFAGAAVEQDSRLRRLEEQAEVQRARNDALEQQSLMQTYQATYGLTPAEVQTLWDRAKAETVSIGDAGAAHKAATTVFRVLMESAKTKATPTRAAVKPVPQSAATPGAAQISKSAGVNSTMKAPPRKRYSLVIDENGKPVD